jgi:sugar/nucleoside kinase (ribokinase family)
VVAGVVAGVVACLGDVMLDVVVEPRAPLTADDDTPARITLSAGGQAANVAAWVVALGGRARLCGPGADSAAGHVVQSAMADRGVELWGSPNGRTGTVVSLLTGDGRTMASDPGDVSWLDDVRWGSWVDGADWLFVSGYALLRASAPHHIVEVARTARAHGTRVAVDLASARMLARYGAGDFSRLCRSLHPSVVFATDAEWTATGGGFAAGGRTVLVLKHGGAGASFVIDGVADDRPVRPGPVVDVTGSGDALAAGYLVGGVDLAMDAAGRCVALRGAQPQVPA